jgi:hypothetical protein
LENTLPEIAQYVFEKLKTNCDPGRILETCVPYAIQLKKNDLENAGQLLEKSCQFASEDNVYPSYYACLEVFKKSLLAKDLNKA